LKLKSGKSDEVELARKLPCNGASPERYSLRRWEEVKKKRKKKSSMYSRH